MLFKLFLSFFKIGFFAFGGGYASISLIQDEIVFSHKWLDLKEFLEVISISQITPGPIAVNAATYIGYKLHGISGSILATFGVILSPILIILIFLFLAKKLKDKMRGDEFLKALQKTVIILLILASLRILKGISKLGLDYKDVIIFILVFILLNLNIIFKKVKIKVYLVLLIAGIVSLFLNYFF